MMTNEMLNILISGTPGTGKSTIVDKLKPIFPEFNFINVSEYAIANNFVTVYDENLLSHILDEEKLFDSLKPLLEEKKFNVIESIHAEIFDDSEIDCVFVCRANNENIYDRLNSRGYKGAKLDNNIQAEIFQLILDEAREQFSEHKIVEIYNNNLDDLERNVELIRKTILEMKDSVKQN